MREIIYSNLLENKLGKIGYKQFNRIYRLTVHKFFPLEPSMLFETMVWDCGQGSERALQEIYMQAKYNIDAIIQPNNNYPFYYFTNTQDIRMYSRLFACAPSEKTLLDMFSDKLLVIA